MVMGRRYKNDGSLVHEFQVNVATDYQAVEPQVAIDQYDNLFFAWTKLYNSNAAEVKMRRYGSGNTAMAGETIVNTFNTGLQNQPSLALSGYSSAFVTWTSKNEDGSVGGVYGQNENDVLDGGAGGADLCEGGAGNDITRITCEPGGGVIITP